MRFSTRLIISSLIVVTVGLVFCPLGSPALAATRDIVVDSEKLTVSTDKDGIQTGELTLLNLSESPVDVTATIANPPGTSVDVEPSLPAGSRTTVTLTFTPPISSGADVVLTFGTGVTPDSYVLKVSPAEGGLEWGLLGRSFRNGLFVSLGLVLGMVAWILVRKWLSSEGKAKFWAKRKAKWFSSGRRKKLYERLQAWFPTEPKVKVRGQSLDNLGTDWSFTGNWFSTVTVGVGALVGLLGTTGVVESIADSAPAAKNALALLAVGGAMTAVMAAVGPLFLKVFGPDPSTPNVIGTLVAAFVTFWGVMGQIWALTLQGQEITSGGIQCTVVVFGWLVGVVSFLVAWRLLWQNIQLGVSEPPPALSDEEKAALILATVQNSAIDEPARKAAYLVLEKQGKLILEAAQKADDKYREAGGDGEKKGAAWLQTSRAHFVLPEHRRNSLL